MLVGIEFKRARVRTEEGRDVWFWRVAPYSQDVDKTKLAAFAVFVLGMSTIFMIASCQ
jgi:hypothetical protein